MVVKTQKYRHKQKGSIWGSICSEELKIRNFKSSISFQKPLFSNLDGQIITWPDYSIRSSDVLNSLEWSNLEERRKRHLLVTMFKIFNNNCPTYLGERFHRASEIHDYNLRGSNYDLQLPLPKTNFLKRSFSYRGAMAWNQLSNKTLEMGDLTTFKLSISQDITFQYVFYLISLILISCCYIVFQIINFFTTIISLDYHKSQIVTFMTVDRNRSR